MRWYFKPIDVRNRIAVSFTLVHGPCGPANIRASKCSVTCFHEQWYSVFQYQVEWKKLSAWIIFIKRYQWSSTSLYFRRKGRYKTSVWSLIQQEVTCKMQTSSCRNLWLSLIHLLWERSEDGFTFHIECYLLSSSARSPLLIYVYDNILIISCYSLDRRSGRYDDAVVINPGNFIRQRWKA